MQVIELVKFTCQLVIVMTVLRLVQEKLADSEVGEAMSFTFH